MTTLPEHMFDGTCPVCARPARFQSPDAWYRDHLRCLNCGSIPRERAFTAVLERVVPGWRALRIHECSPAPERLVSARLAQGCPQYLPTQYFPGVTPGTMHKGVRCENLEALTFADASIDLHVHLDVMEHVNRPDLCVREMARTLVPGGRAIFTTPLYAALPATQRRAIYFPDGIEHLAPPEYHGNPIDDSGALVTFHFGQNLPALLHAWAPEMVLEHVNAADAGIGVLGEFLDVFVLTKPGG